jgi:hypothetical protein
VRSMNSLGEDLDPLQSEEVRERERVVESWMGSDTSEMKMGEKERNGEKWNCSYEKRTIRSRSMMAFFSGEFFWLFFILRFGSLKIKFSFFLFTEKYVFS